MVAGQQAGGYIIKRKFARWSDRGCYVSAAVAQYLKHLVAGYKVARPEPGRGDRISLGD